MNWGRGTFAAAILGVWAAFASTPAYAGAQRQSSAIATIVEYLQLIKRYDLEFGRVIPGTTAGTITVSPFGVVTSSGGATPAGGAPHPAEFSGFGRRNQFVQVYVNATTIQVNQQSGTAWMNVNLFTGGASAADGLTIVGARFRISSTNGVFSFPVGATLNVKANQPSGNYAGTFAITAVYQ